MVAQSQRRTIDHLMLIIGVIGACIGVTGLYVVFPQPYYIIGASFLMLTALYFKLYFFVAFEIILISGHVAIVLGIGPLLQVVLPILLTFQLLFYYYFSEREKSYSLIIAVIGIALISIGFSIHQQWIFLSGSLSIALYSFLKLRQTHYISLIWLILNIIFALTALFRIISSV